MQPVHLARECEHGTTAERDDDRARSKRAQRPRSDELERQLPLEDLQLVLGKGALHERQRVERSEEQDLAVVAGEQ